MKENKNASELLIPVKVVEYFEGDYKDIPYARAIVRIDDRLVRLKVNLKKCATMKSYLDQDAIISLEIVADSNGNAVPRIVGVQ